MSDTIKIISWNVNGIRATVNKGFYERMRELNPDILCIQETKAQDEVLKTISGELNEYELLVNSAVKKGYGGSR